MRAEPSLILYLTSDHMLACSGWRNLINANQVFLRQGTRHVDKAVGEASAKRRPFAQVLHVLEKDLLQLVQLEEDRAAGELRGN